MTDELKTDEEGKGRDRRAFARVPAEIWVEESRAGEIYFQRTANVSEGGLFFEQTIPHPRGTVVNLKFGIPDSSVVIQCRGEVVNLPKTNEGLGMGIMFLDLSEEHKKIIIDFITTSVSNGSV